MSIALIIKIRDRFNHISQVDMVGPYCKVKIVYKREELEMAPIEKQRIRFEGKTFPADI